jgi:hypothetical protein
MLADQAAWTGLLVIPIVGAPWIVAIVWYWRRIPRDDYVPPSMSELARQRLWPR